MAKKTAARGKATKAKAAPTSTGADTPTAATARATRDPREGATSGLASNDPIGADLPTGADLVSSPGRPNETELTRLQREQEVARSTGQEQPHPTMAPRAASTAPDSGPVGRSHQPRQLLDGEEDVPDGAIKVRATKMGEYGFRRRRPGDVFYLVPRLGTPNDPVLDKSGNRTFTKNGRRITKRVRRQVTPEEQFSDAWMEKVSELTPLKESTSGDVMPRGSKAARSRAADDDVI